ncbi:MAG: pyridoxal 5'-phosphate synthase glutaminase subunit PdxT [Thermoplasmata archaeon]|nr:pyridoxal 5'-phosphate synthase glutaminase subunit PdxT [Thermoplasmata archaeon]
MINIGILNIQGDVKEHYLMVINAFKSLKIDGKAILVKNKEDLSNLNGLIIPGGESTTISKFIKKNDLFDKIKNSALDNELGIMGTCAGAIVISKDTGDSRVDPLKLIGIKIKRNAYGRQYSSFQANLEIKGLTSTFSAIFIRAPVIESVENNVDILSKYKNDIVFVAKGKILALTFHPELTNDNRIHKMFIERAGGISTGIS